MVIQVVGLEFEAETLRQAVDLMRATRVGDEEKLPALLHEPLHQGRFPWTEAVPGKNDREAIGPPQTRLQHLQAARLV